MRGLLSLELDKLIPRGQERVGVLLPNVAGTPVILMALWKLGKTPALLNFSTGTTTMITCSELAGLKVIISSRAFVERAKLQIEPFKDAGIQILFLEDVRARISGAQKFVTMLGPDIEAEAAEQSALRREGGGGVVYERFGGDSEGSGADASEYSREYPADAGGDRFAGR